MKKFYNSSPQKCNTTYQLKLPFRKIRLFRKIGKDYKRKKRKLKRSDD